MTNQCFAQTAILQILCTLKSQFKFKSMELWVRLPRGQSIKRASAAVVGSWWVRVFQKQIRPRLESTAQSVWWGRLQAVQLLICHLISKLVTSSIAGSQVVSCSIIPATMISRNVVMAYQNERPTSKHRLLTKPLDQGIAGCHLWMQTHGRNTHSSWTVPFCDVTSCCRDGEGEEQPLSHFSETAGAHCKGMQAHQFSVGIRISSVAYDIAVGTAEEGTCRSRKKTYLLLL